MTPPCLHHWRLASPSGTPYVEGRCRYCGLERIFRASVDDLSLETTHRQHGITRANARALAEKRHKPRATRAKVAEALKEHGPMTRPELAALIGCDPRKVLWHGPQFHRAGMKGQAILWSVRP